MGMLLERIIFGVGLLSCDTTVGLAAKFDNGTVEGEEINWVSESMDPPIGRVWSHSLVSSGCKLVPYLSPFFGRVFLSRFALSICENLELPVHVRVLWSSSLESVRLGGNEHGTLNGRSKDSMLVCRLLSLGYIRVSLLFMKLLPSPSPWLKLLEFTLRTGAGLGVRHGVKLIVFV